MTALPASIRITDREAIRRVMSEGARRGDNTAAKTLTKLVIEKLPSAQHPFVPFETHGGDSRRDMQQPTPMGNQSGRATPPSETQLSQGSVTADTVGGTDSPTLKLNGFPTNGTPH